MQLNDYLKRRAGSPLGNLLARGLHGAEHTAREILQQPWAWRATAEIVWQHNDSVRRFLDGVRRVVFTGAGSSAYAGEALAPLWRARGWDAAAVPTTDLLLDSREAAFAEPSRSVLVSLARSGESPESCAAVERVRRDLPGVRHLIITCNAEGALARRWSEQKNACVLVLPPETNDQSLVMTSSFSSMIVAGQCVAELEHRHEFERTLQAMCAAGERALDRAPEADRLARSAPERVCLLAPAAMRGAAREGALKILESTAGRVAAMADTFLGLRHGFMVFINSRTAVLHACSSGPYEDDLLAELRLKQLGMRHVELDGSSAPVFVIFAQMLAMFLAMRQGLHPDAPSEGGVINRVVQGVRIYDF